MGDLGRAAGDLSDGAFAIAVSAAVRRGDHAHDIAASAAVEEIAVHGVREIRADMCGFLRPPFSSAPNVSTYCDQLVTSTGVLVGPAGAKPTKAAIAVPTPSIGRVPVLTSSM